MQTDKETGNQSTVSETQYLTFQSLRNFRTLLNKLPSGPLTPSNCLRRLKTSSFCAASCFVSVVPSSPLHLLLPLFLPTSRSQYRSQKEEETFKEKNPIGREHIEKRAKTNYRVVRKIIYCCCFLAYCLSYPLFPGYPRQGTTHGNVFE